MKYLCVGYFDPTKMNALSAEEVAAVMSECPPHMERFYESGKVNLVAGVHPEARCLRRAGGKVEVTDSSPEAKGEMIGCVFLIEAADMPDAVRVASLHPTTQIAAGEPLGWRVAIHPVHTFELGKTKGQPNQGVHRTASRTP